ncbi:MAG: SPW repeat protein [Thiohalocapsa sp.]
MATQTYNTGGNPARSNNWQDWANMVLAVWLFVSPWILSFGSGGGAAGTAAAGGGAGGSGVTASWNAWVLGVLVFLAAISAISRMEFWQERLNAVFAVWIFVAPWALGFTNLAAASWDHWIVGVLVFFISLSMLTSTRSTVPASRPPL